jgi:hypothetical protein
MGKTKVTVNRAPVLTLWAAVVAEQLGFDVDTSLTLGKAVAGLTAQAKGRRLGIFKPPKLEAGKQAKKHGLGEELWIELCGRSIPAKKTGDGVRAVVKDRPIDPELVRSYLARAFGDDLATVEKALQQLARALKPDDLAERAFGLYEEFRPAVARGQRGWGQKGELDLNLIRSLGRRA